ncbi:MAG TPA: polysaccharide export protein EpsE [Steroidobacteraceae bacterium]|jgi:polysaccharide export outer membrane protein|nr:polysaccharide export protein EpsE [Steroidobacteraceae bacterium]
MSRSISRFAIPRFGIIRVASSFVARIVLASTAMLTVLVPSVYALDSTAMQQPEYRIGAGDILHITVFKNPDLTLDARVSEVGAISFPLIGSVQVNDLTLPAAEKKIGELLKNGGFVVNPQVNILLTQAFGNQVSVLGEVNKPGRYPLDAAGGHLSGMLATAGGIMPTGSDTVIVTGARNGKPFRREIDMVKAQLNGDTADDIVLAGGDTVFVNHQPVFYIYGQVQKAGQYRLERDMTVMQALAVGGGITTKGTRRGIVLHRRDAHGKVQEIEVSLDDDVKNADVIYVKESLF